MRVALVNPAWSFAGSIYFGCREPHLPLELGYSAALLEAQGCATRLLDGALDGLDNAALARAVADFAPEMTVVATAPTYLFWRCAPPELRVPADLLARLDGRGGRTVAVGPHGSTTPATALRKLGCDIVVRGECEEIIAALGAGHPQAEVPALAHLENGEPIVTGQPHAGRFTDLAPLSWPQAWIDAHAHHHHRFGSAIEGPGAEVEASRGCPYHCTFCAKIDFRDRYRRRDLAPLIAEIDALIAQGARYLYFIDEIFLPRADLLDALAEREVRFGVQTRIDLWREDMLDRLGAAGCVSIEAGVESLSREGRDYLGKKCRLSTDELAERLIRARRTTPFVQANLILAGGDDETAIAGWRDRLRAAGVWANDPVPLYPYPASPDYRRLFGEPDEDAWERAHAWYLGRFGRFSDIQDEAPLSLQTLEASCPG